MILNDILIRNLCILITKSLEGVHDVCVYIINVKIWLNYTKKKESKSSVQVLLVEHEVEHNWWDRRFGLILHQKPYVNFLSPLISKVLSLLFSYSLLFSHSLQKKMPISDQEFMTDPKSPLKKSYLWWQNIALSWDRLWA